MLSLLRRVQTSAVQHGGRPATHSFMITQVVENATRKPPQQPQQQQQQKRSFTNTPSLQDNTPTESEKVHGKLHVENVKSKAMRKKLVQKEEKSPSSSFSSLLKITEQLQNNLPSQPPLPPPPSYETPMSFWKLMRMNMVSGFSVAIGFMIVFAVIRGVTGAESSSPSNSNGGRQISSSSSSSSNGTISSSGSGGGRGGGGNGTLVASHPDTNTHEARRQGTLV